MDIKWIKIRSWHGVKGAATGTRGGQTLCGRWSAYSPVVDDLPTEKSCETCLRIIARRADQG